jgi:cob(I)alamin adenosyltransferase
MLLIFTGNGKGKTTAALGQAMRALGQGKRVLMIQFIKSGQISGEHKFVKKFRIAQSRFKIIPAGKGFVKILGDKKHLSVHKKAAQNALKLVQKAIKGKKWDLIILDEINVAVDLKLIKADYVLKTLRLIPKEIDIILTGRGAQKSFIQKADLVTEMKEVKHPFKKGQVAKKGIEF